MAEKKKRGLWKWISRILLLAALGVFLTKAPLWAVQTLGEDFYLEWLRPARSEWEGILRLWNVYDGGERFDTAVLKEAVRRFERRNRGAFVEYVTLPADAVEERISLRGEPDLWIFPEGLRQTEEADLLLELPVPPEENVLEEEFEFDVGQLEEPEETESSETESRRFFLAVRTNEEKQTAADAFSTILLERVKLLWN